MPLQRVVELVRKLLEVNEQRRDRVERRARVVRQANGRPVLAKHRAQREAKDLERDVHRAALEAGAADERVAHLRRKRRVEPHRRRTRVQRLQREVQRSVRVGVLHQLGVLVGGAQLVQLRLHVLCAPDFVRHAQVAQAQPALRLRPKRVGGVGGVALRSGEERERIRRQAEPLLQQGLTTLRRLCRRLLCSVVVAALLLVVAAAAGRLRFGGARRRQRARRAQLAVDVRCEDAFLAGDHHPSPALGAQRRLLRAHVAQSADAAILVDLQRLDRTALGRRRAVCRLRPPLQDLHRVRRQPIEADGGHERVLMQPPVVCEEEGRAMHARLQRRALGQDEGVRAVVLLLELRLAALPDQLQPVRKDAARPPRLGRGRSAEVHLQVGLAPAAQACDPGRDFGSEPARSASRAGAGAAAGASSPPAPPSGRRPRRRAPEVVVIVGVVGAVDVDTALEDRAECVHGTGSSTAQVAEVTKPLAPRRFLAELSLLQVVERLLLLGRV